MQPLLQTDQVELPVVTLQHAIGSFAFWPTQSHVLWQWLVPRGDFLKINMTSLSCYTLSIRNNFHTYNIFRETTIYLSPLDSWCDEAVTAAALQETNLLMEQFVYVKNLCNEARKILLHFDHCKQQLLLGISSVLKWKPKELFWKHNCRCVIADTWVSWTFCYDSSKRNF